MSDTLAHIAILILLIAAARLAVRRWRECGQ